MLMLMGSARTGVRTWWFPAGFMLLQVVVWAILVITSRGMGRRGGEAAGAS